MLLEVCCGNPASVQAAVEGGARRIELCSALEQDGLTPPWEWLSLARARYPRLIIHVLLRPRAGDFVYSPAEVSQMARDAATALSLGADGLVLGALTPEGEVDKAAVRTIGAGFGNVTFHRAFDVCRDPFRALEDIAELGCARILTSGQAPSAEEGAALIRALREHGPVRLLPGGGVTRANARRILSLTGCTEIHASASAPGPDGLKVTRAEEVAAILAAIAR